MVRSTKSKKIPRPLNAFILYRRDHARKCPGMVAKELSTSLGRSWRTETPERRAFYEEKARQAKILHRQMYPDYTFSPIKRGEGKRAKKLKAMAAQVAVDGASPTVAVKKRMRMASMSLKSSVEVDQAVQRARLALIAEGSTTGRSGATRKSRRLAATRTRYSPPTAQIKKEEPEEETVERYSRHRGQHYPGKNQQVPRCSQMAVLAAEAFDMMALMRRRARSASCSSSSTLSSYASDTDTDDDEDDDDDDDWAPGDQSRTCTSVLSLSFESNYEMAHRSVAGSVCQDSVAQHLLQAKMEPLDARMMLDPSVMLTRPQVMTLELFKRHALNDEGFLSL
ncbi:hypothetical protein DFQ27_008611 [Actinomortierella ambigua]|uniref:HMG box domain-containing protein n=1 Tax=Actinomortierella ambigua TaxID=1343610 RepID=A0A9P6QFX9_9FUNG|nr:hypothetical protein DFQ27_008611 [Actinomortierella ambigua]